MPDPDLAGLRVSLMGHAEPDLVEATRASFTSAGADVAAISDSNRPDGGIDVAVIFARQPSVGPLVDLGDEVIDVELRRQLVEPLLAARAVGRAMASASGGVIVIVGSIDAYHAYPGRSIPAVAMGGLLGLTRALGVELAARDVRANLVIAGPLGDADGRASPGASLQAVERTLLRAPSHRFARPHEVAAAIRFVAGPDSAFMTGQAIRVDGGWSSLNQAPEGMRFP